MNHFADAQGGEYRIQVEPAPGSNEPSVSPETADARARHLEQTLARLAPVVIDAQMARESRRLRQLVDLMLGDQAPTPLDIAKARMQASALRAVFQGTEWLTAAQVCELAGLGLGNPSGTVNRWKQRRRIFALQHDGQDYYPRYLLGDDFRPLDAAEAVLAALPGFDAGRLASWFESRSGLLDGQRPRDLMGTDPQRVIDAARRTLDAELYAA